MCEKLLLAGTSIACMLGRGLKCTVHLVCGCVCVCVCMRVCRVQVLLHAPTPSFYGGGVVSPWVLSHWDTLKKATVAAVVTYPIVLLLALLQVQPALIACILRV